MDQLSRRDTVYQQLGQITDAIRQGQYQEGGVTSTNPSGSASSANDSAILQANANINRYIERVSGQLQNALNLQGNPNASSSSSSSQGGPISMYAARGPVSANPSYDSLAASSLTARGDTLPDYAPPQPSQPITYLHSLKSSSGKLELLLESVGAKEYPVYVQNVHSTVAGRVCLRAQGDESITEVRLRVKGVVTTAVVRGNQSAHNRVLAEEEEFWYSSNLLWSATQPGSALDFSKESHVFPFSIRIPDIAPATPRIRKESPMPPSFILQNGATYQVGGIEIATIRYYVKVTLARKGLLRPNERLFAPIVFLTREKDLSFLSTARRRALAQSVPLPGPTESPDSWQGKVEEKTVKSGFFSSKRGSFKVTLLLPVPLIYGKIESIPYYIRLSSNDQSTLDKLGNSSFLAVNLMQRCCIVSQGSQGSQDNIMSKSQAEEVTVSEPSANSAEPARRFKGVLDIKTAVGSAVSFKSLNIELSFWVVCYSMDKGLIHDTLAAIPVKIVSIPPAVRPVQNAVQGQAAVSEPAPEMEDLPPAYFEVVEAGQSAGRTSEKS